MKAQRQKWYHWILYVLLLILLIPAALIGMLVTVAWFVMLPFFERAIYARSAYFAGGLSRSSSIDSTPALSPCAATMVR